MKSSSLFALIVLSIATLGHAQVLPRVDTAVVLDAADGTGAAGAEWRAWPVADPTKLVASGAADAVGLVRPGAAWIRFPQGMTDALALDRVAAIETSLADPRAPGRRAGLFAAERTSAAIRMSLLAPMRLVRMSAPRASLAGSDVTIQIDPAIADGVPLVTTQGLESWQILRSPEGTDAYTIVGSAPSSAVIARFTDVAVPAGTFAYAVRPVFVGGIAGRFASPAAPPISTGAAPCPEPSALDQDPRAIPLLVSKAGGDVRVSWQPIAGASFDVYRGSLAAIRAGSSDLASAGPCRIGASSAIVTVAPGDVLLVASHCGATLSSLGRRSDGIERALPGTLCP